MKELSIEPRDYQKNIFQAAKENNTLVVLPTGVGKTLIAIMLSVERQKKFPGKKVLMLAPTKPLVEQHLESFKKVLPELFADLQLFTGAVTAQNRKKIWQTADIIFSTPQCVAHDVKNYLYDLKDVSLLVIDEAHRCLKNYDYNYLAQTYKQQAENQLILGLTASPGSDQKTVRQICNNLAVDEVEIRTRDSPDVVPYLQDRHYQKIEVPFPAEFMEIRALLKKIYDVKVEQLKNRNLLFGPSNKIALLKLQQRLAVQASPKNFNAMIGMSLCAQAVKISHAIELLETQTLSGTKDYLSGLIQQAEQKKSKGVQTLVKSKEFNLAYNLLNKLIENKVEHPKIAELEVLIDNEFKVNPNAKIIIFTQFRETASAISLKLSAVSGARPKVFVGQAKRSSSSGTTGLSQKEQRQIIEDLNEGKVNILVATSIGEEGLDIAEVSAVYFYEPIPSAIRKIQRAGRTARLKPGKLCILITKGTRDEINHYASTAREKKMHKIIEGIKQELKSQPKKSKDLNYFFSK